MGTAQCGGEPLPAIEKRFAHAYCLYVFCEKPKDATAMLFPFATLMLPVSTLRSVPSRSQPQSLFQPAATRSSSSPDSSIGWVSFSMLSMLLSLDVSGAILL